MNKPKVTNPQPTNYKSKCCDAPVVQYDPIGKGAEKHWLGHQCTKCGNQAPLKTKDLMEVAGIKS